MMVSAARRSSEFAGTRSSSTGNTSHGADGNQFEAEILEIAADIRTPLPASQEITTLLVALVAQNSYWLGIHQIECLSVPTFLDDPIPA